MKKKNNTLILGLGNDILTDDGIGPKLVMKLKKTIEHPDVNFVTAATGGLEILEIIKGYSMAIIIDAIKTRNGIPGTIYYLTPSNFKETLHVSSFHDISFLTALSLAEKMDIPVPSQIFIIAIEIVEDLTFSDTFSPPIAKKYDQIVLEVTKSVRKMIF